MYTIIILLCKAVIIIIIINYSRIIRLEELANCYSRVSFLPALPVRDWLSWSLEY